VTGSGGLSEPECDQATCDSEGYHDHHDHNLKPLSRRWTDHTFKLTKMDSEAHWQTQLASLGSESSGPAGPSFYKQTATVTVTRH
jgi:hypothetical protein